MHPIATTALKLTEVIAALDDLHKSLNYRKPISHAFMRGVVGAILANARDAKAAYAQLVEAMPEWKEEGEKPA